MICPYCSADDDRVIDSRASEAGLAIRRRRQCNACGRRFTTYERVEETNRLVVIKRDGARVPFKGENILRGVHAACGKRPVPETDKRQLVELVEDELHREFDREVESSVIGERVAARLRDLDEIAYIRFASEHEQFRSVSDIMDTVRQLSERVRDVKDQQKLFDG
ncbi:MAG: transcriptional repressor NrdR [Phycisphaeraceae bacterium]|nr:MAG: transcriptional repressor NrdR [Phycisphaeraceae bacterium]